jgi:hypothetical protein
MRQLRLAMPNEFRVGQVYKHERDSCVGFETVFDILNGQPIMGHNADSVCPWGPRPRPGDPALIPSDMSLDWTYVGSLTT